MFAKRGFDPIHESTMMPRSIEYQRPFIYITPCNSVYGRGRLLITRVIATCVRVQVLRAGTFLKKVLRNDVDVRAFAATNTAITTQSVLFRAIHSSVISNGMTAF